jgi:hypothetical protein
MLLYPLFIALAGLFAFKKLSKLVLIAFVLFALMLGFAGVAHNVAAARQRVAQPVTQSQAAIRPVAAIHHHHRR